MEEEQEFLVCEVCGNSNETVSEQICGYSLDIDNEIQWEVICDACEHEHCMDI